MKPLLKPLLTPLMNRCAPDQAPDIGHLRAHDPQAWSWCVAEFAPAIQNYARSAGHCDPAEVVGAVLETLARRIDEFEGDLSQLRAFVFTVAHARIVDEYRRQNRVKSLDPEDPTQIVPDAQHQLASEVTPHAPEHLLIAIAGLAPLQRQVIEMRYLQGLSVEEVANLTQRSQGAVRTATSRGLQQLRVRLIAPTK